MPIAARGLGSLAAAFWLATLLVGALASVLSGEPPDAPALGAILMVLVVAASAGVGVGWRRERLGGVVTLASALALATFAYVTAGRNKWLAVSISAGPFLLAGLLFLVSSRLTSDPH